MSEHRISPKAGFVAVRTLPKGPNGRALCRRCSTECPKGRQTFCSDICVHEWKVRTQPGYVRRKLFERDKGVCAICGVDTVAALRKMLRREPYPNGTMGHLWHADHVVPVVEGGGECGLENYRTLCVEDHRRVTAELKARLAKKRREAAAPPVSSVAHTRPSSRAPTSSPAEARR